MDNAPRFSDVLPMQMMKAPPSIAMGATHLVVVGGRGGLWRLVEEAGGDESSGFIEPHIDDAPCL